MTSPRLIFVLGLAAGLPPCAAAQSAGDEPIPPVTHERKYQVNARIRPVLFWIRRNDVGAARIIWRGDRQGAHGYELLAGSDPARTPRRINRWGYISETVSENGAVVTGVMKRSNEESIEDAERELARDGDGGHLFTAIHSRLESERYQAEIVHLRSAADLTFRDVDALLARVAAIEVPPRTLDVPRGTAPGLLSALADMLHESVSGSDGNPNGRPVAPRPRTYVYNARLYLLTLRSVTPREDFTSGDRRYGPAVEGEFEILNRTTQKKTRFSIVYGRSGALAEVPLKIVLRPRWWFEAELVLAN
jgi:hypothetical protein